ncbi:MAG TPA: PEPxxWA-CTERM sorting domain-containing protein [Planctomycetaceae bacterium]|nr:PEPxxWA-CTERM sorting domain-containing protein [Planctomycetaceae bacterium]
MKRILLTLGATLAASVSAPAFANVNMTTNNGQLATHINADDGTVVGDGTIKYGTTDKDNAPNNVLFDANTDIRITGGGFALIEDVDKGKDGVQDFASLLVNPDEDFTAIDFSLQLLDILDGNETFDIYYTLVGGAQTLLGSFEQAQNGLEDYIITGDNGEVFDSIFIQATGGSLINFEKQNSLTLATAVPPGVPEPSTWAMMLLGFGGIGAAMRRRRRTTALLQIA